MINSPRRSVSLRRIAAEMRRLLGRRSVDSQYHNRRPDSNMAIDTTEILNYGVADTFTRAERSRIMAAVKARGNKLTEARLVDLFRRHGMTGWRRHLPIKGKPDFTFVRQRVVIFVDGCFWHGCARHLRMPQSNQAYWEKKIFGNVIRDRITTALG